MTTRAWIAIRAAAVAAALVLPCGIAAQQASEWDSGRAAVSRQQLEETLARYEQTAGSGAYSGELRARARHEAAMIRTRLAEGDFRVGDRVTLVVEGEPDLSDTFTVSEGPVLTLPLIGDIPLDGVLRSELESHLTQHIAQQIRDPVVHAQSTIRVSIDGAVGQPGFYSVPTTQLLTESIMEAGGPGQDAKLTRIYIERGGERIWEGEALQDAIIEGRTLDQLSLRAGDRIVVPESGNSPILTTLRYVGIVGGAAWAIVRISQLF